VRDALKEYFERYPHYAKFFELRCDAQGRIQDGELERVAKDRLIIRLTPK
jgi:hypothetical protein